MTLQELYKNASELPLVPGVYIMYNAKGVITYIGKAVKLRNRVSQYFAPRADRDYKTSRMIASVDHFEVIITRTEMEALILECTLIKQHKPRYNILLKDDKAYPYLYLNTSEGYPRLELANKRDSTGEYYGPFGGRYLTNTIIATLKKTLKLPDCTKVFPRDIGKERPCLNFHLGVCDGWCRFCKTESMYLERITQLREILNGRYNSVAEELKHQMESAADALDFETAAELRDRRAAILSLKEKQIISTGRKFDADAVGFYHTEDRFCFCVLHFIGGVLLDKDFELIEDSYRDDEASALIRQYYLSRNTLPKRIYTPFEFPETELLAEILTQRNGSSVSITVPKIGSNVTLLKLAERNAEEELERTRTSKDRGKSVLHLLETMTGLQNLNRLEAFDISHTGGADIVAGMVVYEAGAFQKRHYKRFQLKNMENQDDYGAMRQVLERRLSDYLSQKEGFEVPPDLLLMDGGAEHAAVVEDVLRRLGLTIPVLGMVKDSHHKTRGLITASGEELNLAANQAVFSLIGSIQEEVHRYAISYHRNLRSKRMKKTNLDDIPTVGKARKEALLHRFRSESGIQNASLDQLRQVVPEHSAKAIFDFYHRKGASACELLQEPQEELH